MPELSEDDRLAVIKAELSDCIGGEQSSLISEKRRKALAYYNGKPFGNEVDGRSKLVLTDVADVIEWMMPPLMRVFLGSRNAVRYSAVGPEDAEMAEQATAWAHMTFTRHNNGYLVFYQWIKDALLEMNGFIRYGWEQKSKRYTRNFAGIREEQLAAILDQKELQVTVLGKDERIEQMPIGIDSVTGVPVTQPVRVFDVELAYTKTRSCFRIYNIPPEEFLVSKRSTLDLDEARFVAWQTKKTIGDLVALGFDKDDLVDLPSDDPIEYSPERIERYETEDDGGVTNRRPSAPDDTTREVWLTECFVRMDADGDGIQELRRVIVAGGRNAFKILLDKEVSDIPFATITPTPMSHAFYGKSIAEQVMDLQLSRSTVLRNMMDNLFLVNNVRYAAMEGECEIDDLISNRPGGVVRVRSQGAVTPLATAPLGPMAFNMLEYLHTIRENRTGITRYNQGTDATSLNQTATGVKAIMGASQVRIDLVARVMAETGVKRLFKAMLQSAVDNASEVRGELVLIHGEWIKVDPSKWNPDMDVEIEVGLGIGDAQLRMGQVRQIMEVQQGAQGAGMGGRVVTEDNFYNAAKALVDEMGYKAQDLFFTNPKQLPPPEPAPDADMAKAQAEIEKGKAELALDQARFQLEQQKVAAQIQMNELKTRSEIALATARAESEQKIGRMRAVSGQMTKAQVAEHDMALEDQRAEHEREMSAKEESDDAEE